MANTRAYSSIEARPQQGGSAPDQGWPVATVHRPLDGLRALLSLIVLISVLASISALPLGTEEITANVTKWVSHFPRWLALGATVVAGLGCFGLMVAATVALIRHSPRGALRAWVAALTAATGAAGARAVWTAQKGTIGQAVVHGTRPLLFIIGAAFLAFMIASDLLHRSTWARWTVVTESVFLLAGVADGVLTPFALVTAVLWGATAGWGIRWALGIRSNAPGRSELVAWLADRHLDAVELSPVAGRQGQRVHGVLADGRQIDIQFASGDSDWSGLGRWLWAAVRLRPTATGRTAVTSRSRLKELALVCDLVEKAGVPAPRLLALHVAPHDHLALVSTTPAGQHPAAGLDPRVGTSLFQALSAVHRAGVAHRDLRPENLAVVGSCGGFSNVDSSLPGATNLTCLLDVAQLVTTVTRLSDADTGVKSMRAGYADLDETALASVLQPVALVSWGWSDARSAKGCIEEVRSRLAVSEAEAPPVRIERFSLRTVISAAALVIASYILVGQISSVNLAGALAHMKLQWFALALAGSALTYVAAAGSLLAFVRKRVSMLKTVLVQLAASFVGVAMPSVVGSVAINSRFLIKQGVEESEVAADITSSQAVNAITTILLVLVLALLTGAGVSPAKVVPSTDVLLAVAALAVLIVVLALIPRTRRLIVQTVRPHLKGVVPKLLEALSQPARLAASAGSSVLLNIGYVTAFMGSLYAVGAHASVLAAAVVYMIGGFLGSATPTPGGLGGVEAALVAGVAGIGIPAGQAIPAVIVFRFATFWLPIPFGWGSYQYLQRSGGL